ncbi:DnaJ domain protein-like protein [Angomonas deanei]|nr:DnaJ domain protein-like protein [Angomonas deanei]|eukprot:EPY36264.1 DnaJ domain protein-like protein [Angomonas deanei]
MFRRFGVRCAPQRDPFKVLGLTRAATKAEVKMKYRELARIYHPDSESGDGVKMEQVNHAYKLLMKEGGYERMHLKRGSGVAQDGPAGVTAERRRPSATPYSSDQHEREKQKEDVLSDEEMAKVGALDPSTERVTPEGKYLYQNRDDGTWVELSKRLVRADKPHYASFSAKRDMDDELRRMSQAKERIENEKSKFEKFSDRLSDTAELPSNRPWVLKLGMVSACFVFYLTYKRSFARGAHHKSKHQYYKELDNEREELLAIYDEYKAGIENSVNAAALVFLAAAKKKKMSDPVVQPPPEVYYHYVKPPSSHFDVHAGV